MATRNALNGAQLIVDYLIQEGVPQVFGLCGHGHFDLSAYDAYLAGTLEDPEFSQADMDRAIAKLPGVIAPFPGGVCRSGSKVGSKYKALVASIAAC